MRKGVVVIFICIIFMVGACKKKAVEIREDGEMTEEQIEAYTNDTASNKEGIEYNGTFIGMVNGKKVKLDIDESRFTCKIGGEKIKGDINRVNDGSEFELVSASGELPFHYLAWVADDQILVLEDGGAFPEDEKDEIYLEKEE